MSPKAVKTAVAAFCLSMLALITLGLVMVASTGAAFAYQGDAFYFAKRQALWLAIGMAACAITARLDYHVYRKYAWWLFIATLVLLFAVLIMGRRINGATRWLTCGPIRFQPSELAKYALVIVLAFWLERMQRAPKGHLHPRVEHVWWGICIPIAITSTMAGLILKEPDFGTTVLLLAIALALMWVGGASWRWLAAIVAAGGMAIAAALVAILRFGMFMEYYQVRRFVHWWRWDDLHGSNFQQYISQLAIGSGGTSGCGLGNSRMKLGFLPEAHTDFIFPVIGEELGLVATFGVVLAFFVLASLGLMLARRAPDPFGVLVGVGITLVIGLQALINLGVATSLLPNKGMALPFISYGGSNLVVTLAAIGVLLNISMQAYENALNQTHRSVIELTQPRGNEI